MNTIAIHQPNFFPWLGFFDKICRADVFVLLDDVQYQKTGGTWSNRVKVLINGEGRWLTAPLDRAFHGTRCINQLAYTSKKNWRIKIHKTLQSAYGRAPFYAESMDILGPLIDYPAENVAEYNIHAIISLSKVLGIQNNVFIKSSDIPTSGVATQRLVEIIRHVNGSHYLCGGGAGGYQENSEFGKRGIALVYQNYVGKQYRQLGRDEFVYGLSIIDALSNIGLSGVSALISSVSCE